MFKWCHPKLTEMDESDVRAIVGSALRILRRVPMTIDGTDEFYGYLRDFGCEINGKKVSFPDAVIDRTMARIAQVKKNAPSEIAPPPTEIRWSVSGQAFLTADTRTDELRPATKKDLATFSRVVEAIPGLERSHPTYIPQDAPLRTRELHAFATIILNSGKPHRVSMYSPEVLPYYLRILEVVSGDAETAKAEMRELMPSKVWVNTPMMISRENVAAPMAYRRLADQPLHFSTMPVAGAATPVTVAGCIALSTAEVIACNAIALAVDDRAAGWVASPLFFDMKTGAAVQWGPETLLLQSAASHVACRLFGGVPKTWMPLSVSAQVPGLQSALERAYSIALTYMGGNRLFGTLSTLGHSDIGSTVQLMIDLEIVDSLRCAARGFEVNAETLAEEVICEVAPRGAYFLDTDHTAMSFRKVSWFPELLDRRVPHVWKENPSNMLDLAREKAVKLEESAPNRCPLDEAQKKEIERLLAAADKAVADE